MNKDFKVIVLFEERQKEILGSKGFFTTVDIKQLLNVG